MMPTVRHFSVVHPIPDVPYFGYGAQHGSDMLLGDTSAEFAAACVRLAREPGLGNAVAEHVWQNFLERWTWDAIRPRVIAAAAAIVLPEPTGASGK
jgi:hypothetical protein